MNKGEEKEVIQLLASGQPQEQIAEVIGVSQSTISRVAKKHQESIQKETERLLQSLPDIIDQITRDIKTSNELSKALADPTPEGGLTNLSPLLLGNSKILTKFMELSYKKQSDVLRAVGILPSVAQSVFIQNLIQKNTTNILSPVVMRVLGDHIRKSLEEPEPINVTPVEPQVD